MWSTKKILILGCGWVGGEFARYARKQGAQILATTTSPDKAHRLDAAGIQTRVHDFDTPDKLQLNGVTFDYILNSIPASRKMETAAVLKRFDRVRETLRGLHYKKHLYLSSIGIYPDKSGIFDEDFADPDALDATLAAAENSLMPLPDTVVYRLGGLFGKQRILARYFEDRICTTGEQPANFIHLDDVVALIGRGMCASLHHQVYNIVCPHHPKKEEVIRASAAKYGLRLPEAFRPVESPHKMVSGERIANELNYTYLYPSPLLF